LKAAEIKSEIGKYRNKLIEENRYESCNFSGFFKAIFGGVAQLVRAVES
tara:strand:- start:316 stop:462 length:147 start_codon:yes stop_codon:yes gene_type:complete